MAGLWKKSKYLSIINMTIKLSDSFFNIGTCNYKFISVKLYKAMLLIKISISIIGDQSIMKSELNMLRLGNKTENILKRIKRAKKCRAKMEIIFNILKKVTKPIWQIPALLKKKFIIIVDYHYY